MSQNNFPKLHNAMWPGLVGKGGPGAEPAEWVLCVEQRGEHAGECCVDLREHDGGDGWGWVGVRELVAGGEADYGQCADGYGGASAGHPE